MTEDSKMNRANALRSSVAPGVLLRVIALGAAGAIGSAFPAEAALYYYRDSDPGSYNQQQSAHPPRRQQQHARKTQAKKETQVKDTTVHPQMPLIINVSIAKQKVRIYDANGFFAEAPVSTGMPGHPTPMGVFSVIQKDRYHHSNIYSGAPMPFMQRITWGGVAMHAGVLPGYPASHGCIRMPESFAVKMWGWTKMGARVIVTPGELTPASFEHALLPTMKVVPQPPVAELPETNEPVAAKADKGALDAKPIEAKLELRSTVGHSENIKPSEEAPLRDQTHTADANDTRSTPATMSDASSASSEPAHETSPAKTDEAKADTSKADAAKSDTSKTETAKAETTSTDTPKDSLATSDAAKPAEAAAIKAEDKPAEPKAETAKVDTPKAETAKADTPPAPKPDTAKPETAKLDTRKPDAAKADTAKADTAKPAAKPAEPVKAATDASQPAADAKKDQTRVAKPAKQEARRRDGQLAVFVSRKDSKLYVRQNFAPLFDVPVTIAPSERPLGTHVFTAEVDKTDTNILHWSVITVPLSARAAMRDSDEPRRSRRQKGKPAPAPVEAKPAPLPNSAAEALDRITIPADVMARISEAMTSGASIVVSDQGINQGETGEYTDFIVRYY
jgi:lipoprotein-anchoring transpeptidase ErfK/SrfK